MVFVESTISDVTEMTKKLQVQGSSKNTHYLSQTRSAALNNQLQDKFASWYPEFVLDLYRGGKLYTSRHSAPDPITCIPQNRARMSCLALYITRICRSTVLK